MIWRNVARRPLRAGLSVLGIALAVAILVVGRYFVDSIQLLTDLQFRTVQREDLTVAFREPLPASARHAVASLPGVLRSEPFRIVPARLRFEHAIRRVPLFGLEPTRELRRLVDSERAVYAPPLEGVVLTTRLARILGVTAGDEIEVEVLEGARPKRRIARRGRGGRADRALRLPGCAGAGSACCARRAASRAPSCASTRPRPRSSTRASSGCPPWPAPPRGSPRSQSFEATIAQSFSDLHDRPRALRVRDRGRDGVQRGAHRALRARARAREPAGARLHAARDRRAAARRAGAAHRCSPCPSASRSGTRCASGSDAPISASCSRSR